jgi:hypothetical protein
VAVPCCEALAQEPQYTAEKISISSSDHTNKHKLHAWEDKKMHLDRYVLLGAMTMGICACGGAAGQEPSEAQMKEAALYAVNRPA